MLNNTLVNEAIEFILLHLWENITLQDVADHCNISKYYFSRMFKEETGESVYAFIKRLKIEQSAIKLKVERDRSVTDISMDYGYSPSNYSSAFRQYLNSSPIEYRRMKQNEVIELYTEEPYDAEKIFQDYDSKISIEILPEYYVLYERRISCYSDMRHDWMCFIEKYKEYITDKTVFFDRTYDDPTITDKNKCIYDICMTIDKSEGFSNTCIIAGGKYAVYPFKGVMEDIMSFQQRLVGIWFPLSHYELDDRYSFERYHYVDIDSNYMEFDICIPIK